MKRPEKVPTTIRMVPEFREKVQEAAYSRGRSMSDWVVSACEDALRRQAHDRESGVL